MPKVRSKKIIKKEITLIDEVGDISQVPKVNVAHACHFSHVVDHGLFFHTMTIDYDDITPQEDRLVIVGARREIKIQGQACKKYTRGKPRGDGCMANSLIVDVNFMNNGIVYEPSIKVFKNYLHFCKCDNIEVCTKIADKICEMFRNIQEKLTTPEGRKELITPSLERDEFMKDADKINKFNKWVEKINSPICTMSLTHYPVNVSMANYNLRIGSYINTLILVKKLVEELPNWTITYDNVISLDIILTKKYDDDKNENVHSFKISFTGRIAFSYQIITDECHKAFEEVISIIKKYKDDIIVDPPETRSGRPTPKMK